MMFGTRPLLFTEVGNTSLVIKQENRQLGNLFHTVCIQYGLCLQVRFVDHTRVHETEVFFIHRLCLCISVTKFYFVVDIFVNLFLPFLLRLDFFLFLFS